jgi:hypothetical protein
MPSYWKEEIEPNRPKKKPFSKIPFRSANRAELEKEKKAAYKIIHETRPHCCEESSSSTYEHSHNFPVKPFLWLIGMPENITLYHREHHLAWEDSRLHELPNTAERLIKWMMFMIETETDIKRKKMMSDHVWNKVYNALDRCMDDNVEPPEWLVKMVAWR